MHYYQRVMHYYLVLGQAELPLVSSTATTARINYQPVLTPLGLHSRCEAK